MMQRHILFIVLVPLALIFIACSLPNMSQAPTPGASTSTAAKTLTVGTDTTRNQGVLVTEDSAQLDIKSMTDDGTVVNCVDALGIAPVTDGANARTVSGSGHAIIIGTRNDGMPGAWVYSSKKIESVIDEDSGKLTSVLPECAEKNDTFRGRFGWVYHVMGVSEDAKVIIGYAENRKGFSFGKLQIDKGTTIGVYWRVSPHPSRPFFMVSRAHIIGTFDLSKVKVSNKRIQRFIDWALQHALDQLKLFLLDYLSSYLTMVEKNGVHFDSANNVYLVSGTDQDDNPAVATIDQSGGITIAASNASAPPNIYAAGFYSTRTVSGTTSIAAYWLNGVKTDLPGDGNASDSAVANSVFVSGSTVYAAGYYFNGTTNVACYWTGTTKTDLPGDGTGVNQASASSIFVSGGTVYTAGFYNNGTTSIACYWTGTSKQDLPGTGGANANSIYFSGGTIYTAGQYNTAYNTATTSTACYWTGTSKQDLPGTNGANASSLFVSGGTIYTAGQYNAATASIASYWTGTVKTDLPGAGANASSIYVSGGTVYTAGYYASSGTTVACYWTGTTKTDLPGAGAQANSVFVQ
ncbi:MAG: hypothetical protein ABSB63_02565 [Spirochaetia bacterium]|jgi:hypothetical protein